MSGYVSDSERLALLESRLSYVNRWMEIQNERFELIEREIESLKKSQSLIGNWMKKACGEISELVKELKAQPGLQASG